MIKYKIWVELVRLLFLFAHKTNNLEAHTLNYKNIVFFKIFTQYTRKGRFETVNILLIFREWTIRNRNYFSHK